MEDDSKAARQNVPNSILTLGVVGLLVSVVVLAFTQGALWYKQVSGKVHIEKLAKFSLLERNHRSFFNFYSKNAGQLYSQKTSISHS